MGAVPVSHGRWHPFGGAGGGITKYYDTGTQLYLEAGTRYDAGARWGGELRVGVDMLGTRGSLDGGAFIDAGIWYSLWE